MKGERVWGAAEEGKVRKKSGKEVQRDRDRTGDSERGRKNEKMRWESRLEEGIERELGCRDDRMRERRGGKSENRWGQ